MRWASLAGRLLLTHGLVATVAVAAVAVASSLLFRSYYLHAREQELIASGTQIAALVRPRLGDAARRDEIALISQAAANALGGRVCIFGQGTQGLIAACVTQEPQLSEDIRRSLEMPPTGQVSVTTTTTQCLPGPALSITVPIRGQGGAAIGTVLLRSPVAGTDAVVAAEKTLTLGAGVGAIALAALLSLGVARAIGQRVRAMSESATRLADGDFSARVSSTGITELAALGESFNRMAESLQGAFAELSREHDRLADLLASMAEGVISVDGAGAIRVVNDRARELLGAGEQDWIGTDPRETAGEQRWGDVLRQAATHALPETEDWTEESGDTVLRFHTAPIRGAHGGALLVVEDLSQARRLELMRRDFVANASHQLRAPLTSLRGFLEAVHDGTADTPQAQAHCVEVALEQVTLLQETVDRLLTLSRLQARIVEMTQEPVSLGEVAERACRHLAPQAQRKGLSLSTEADAGVVVLGDPLRLLESAVNLLDNAIRHSPEQGEIRLSAARHDGRARLVVADEGPGISPDHLSTVWERFHHVPGERSPGGAGLGLAIVREIIEQHGGEVFAESEVGEGSTFGFELPLRQ